MEFIIRGDKIKVTDSMKNYIEEKLGKLEKYLKDGDSVRANVVVKVRNKNQIVEITIPLKTIILRSKHNKSNKEFMIIDEEESIEEESIVKRKTIEVKPMNEEEAILQMELLGHQFYMYLDSDKEKYCVVYKRKEGGYGVLES